MKVSSKIDYALHAMMYISAVNGKKLSTIDQISENEKIPREYLAKILKELTQKGFLSSWKGVHGGYKLAKPRGQITFLDIMEAMEGPLALALCNLSETQRNGTHRKGQCAAYTFFDDLKKKVVKDLTAMNFGKLDYDKYYPAFKAKA
jgi:Rrf2 family transcriptional regulator, iron-sulfur cluster assembly transcription factor